jgi:hypothetical protein
VGIAVQPGAARPGRAVALAVLMSLLGLGSPAAAEIYRYTDASGRERFTTDLGEVPPAQRDAARRSPEEPRSGSLVRHRAPSSPGYDTDPRRDGPEATGDEDTAAPDETDVRTEHAALLETIATLEQRVAGCEEAPPPVDRYDLVTGEGPTREQRELAAARAVACRAAAEDLAANRAALARLEERAQERGVPLDRLGGDPR